MVVNVLEQRVIALTLEARLQHFSCLSTHPPFGHSIWLKIAHHKGEMSYHV